MGPFQPVDLFEALSRDALQITVHARRGFENSQEFAVPFGPLLVLPLVFFFEVAAQLSIWCLNLEPVR